MNAVRSPFLEQQEQLFDQHCGERVPPFPDDIAKCHAFNASPYLLSLPRFAAGFANGPRRRQLFDALVGALATASDEGAEIVAVLVGGSYLVPQATMPKDLDAIVFYTATPGRSDVAARLRGLWERTKSQSLDLRFIPYDADPVVALKACSFFSLLYARTRASAELSRGAVLIAPPFAWTEGAS
jgi:hypothetical protein